MGLGLSWIFRPSGRKFDIGFLNYGVLGGLVGITGDFSKGFILRETSKGTRSFCYFVASTLALILPNKR